MYNRGTTSAVRGLRRLNAPSSSSCCNARRFGATTRNDVRAMFRETENTELDKVLAEIQEKIVFPAHLPEKQRKIVFSQSKRAYLEQNPIIIEVEGVEHKFETLNKVKDIRAASSLLHEVLGAMETQRDWENLPTLLAGFHKAGIKIGTGRRGKVTRKACDKGQVTSILESAKQAGQTGFFIESREQMTYLMRAICEKIDAADGDWKLIRSAGQMADLLLEVVQRPDHQERSVVSSPRDRLQFSLTVRGQVLYTKASLFKAKKEAEESVEKDLLLLTDEIKVLSSLWARYLGQDVESIPEFQELHPPRDLEGRRERQTSNLTANSYVASLARNIQAIEVAQKLASENAVDFSVVMAALEEQLVPAAKMLDAHLQRFLQTVSKNREELAKLYESILGRQPSLA